MTALAARLGATEGQVWSIAVGLLVASLLALTGIPPAMRDRDEVAATPVFRPAPAAAHVESAPTTTVPTVAEVALPAGPVDAPVVFEAPVADVVVAPRPFGAVELLGRVGAPAAGVTVDAAGRVVVATGDGPSRVLVLDTGGASTRDVVVAGRLPGLARLADGGVVAADAVGSRVVGIDASTGAQRVLATIPDIPACGLAPGAASCEPGLQGHDADVRAVATTADGTVFVADAAQATIWRIPPGRVAQPWYQSVQLSAGEGATALDVAPDGSVVVAVATDLYERSPLAGSVRRIVPGDDGRPASAAVIAELGRDQRPAGLVVGRDGRIFVLLRNGDAVLVLDAHGGAAGRITDASMHEVRGLGGWLDGALLVTTAAGEVFRVSV